MAATAHSTLDSLRLLHFLHDQGDGRLAAMCMGSHGQLTRIAAPLFGSALCYAALKENQATAGGQLTLEELLTGYHFSKLSRFTKLYGLIGDPVDKSLSYYTHNHAMQQLGLDALYVRMQVTEPELGACLHQMSQLGFAGLSATMPLKEKILPYLDNIDPEARQMGAVNTIVFRNKKSFGYNTDGIGALNSIEEVIAVSGKLLLIVGAGGAARAIAFEALKRGARVTILNRDGRRALQAAAAMGSPHCTGDELSRISFYAEEYDVLVNATPADMPIESSRIRPGTIVMDIKSKPLMTPFLLEAKARGAVCIPGYRMFIHQAVEQFRLWFGDAVDPTALLRLLEARINL